MSLDSPESCKVKFISNKHTVTCNAKRKTCLVRAEEEEVEADRGNWLMAADHTATSSDEIVTQSDAQGNISHCRVCFK